MHNRNDLWVVVPAFNEAQTIGQVVFALRAEGYSAVVVDDGSTDRTAEIAEDGGAIVLRHSLNLGQGGALQTGIQFCLRCDAGFICTFDADGQHRVEDIARLWTRLASEKYDIIMGSRFLGSAEQIPFSRKLLLKLAVLFTRCHSGLKLTDTHNGLRVMTAQAASALRIKQLGMAHASEIIDLIAGHKLRYCEIPVRIFYTEYTRKKGQSGWGAIRIIFELILGHILK